MRVATPYSFVCWYPICLVTVLPSRVESRDGSLLARARAPTMFALNVGRLLLTCRCKQGRQRVKGMLTAVSVMMTRRTRQFTAKGGPRKGRAMCMTSQTQQRSRCEYSVPNRYILARPFLLLTVLALQITPYFDLYRSSYSHFCLH